MILPCLPAQNILVLICDCIISSEVQDRIGQVCKCDEFFSSCAFYPFELLPCLIFVAPRLPVRSNYSHHSVGECDRCAINRQTLPTQSSDPQTTLWWFSSSSSTGYGHVITDKSFPSIKEGTSMNHLSQTQVLSPLQFFLQHFSLRDNPLKKLFRNSNTFRLCGQGRTINHSYISSLAPSQRGQRLAPNTPYLPVSGKWRNLYGCDYLMSRLSVAYSSAACWRIGRVGFGIVYRQSHRIRTGSIVGFIIVGFIAIFFSLDNFQEGGGGFLLGDC